MTDELKSLLTLLALIFGTIGITIGVFVWMMRRELFDQEKQ